jgi:hypothetical protein
MGASTVARLQADSDFRADVEAARAEVVAVRASGLKPQRGCKEESEAMALQPLPLRKSDFDARLSPDALDAVSLKHRIGRYDYTTLLEGLCGE